MQITERGMIFMKKSSISKSTLLALITGVALVIFMLIIGRNLYVGDRMLNCYIPSYKALANRHMTFAQTGTVPVFGPLQRDCQLTEVSLFNLCFILLPIVPAFIITFAIRYIIAVFGTCLLAKTLLKEKYEERSVWATLIGIALSLVPVNAYLGFSMASIPLVIYMFIGLKNRFAPSYCLALVLIPFISEFYHVGLTILIVGICTIVFLCIKNRHFYWQMLVGWLGLALGYVLSEYRVIRMLFSYDTGLWEWLFDTWTGRENIILEILFIVFVLIILAAFILIIRIDISDENVKNKKVLQIVAIITPIIFLLVPLDANVFVGQLVHGNELGVEKYYSEALFEKVKEEIDYLDQWTYAYDLPASVLVVNDYRTISSDVYDAFEGSEIQIDEYYEFFPELIEGEKGDFALFDIDEFKKAGGRLLISGSEIDNAEDNGMCLVSYVDDENSPYSIYVYQTKSRYRDKEHCNIPFEQRELSYDYDEMQSHIDKLAELIKNAEEDVDIEMFESLFDTIVNDLDILSASYSMWTVKYNQNTFDSHSREMTELIYEDYLILIDEFDATLRDATSTPYRDYLEKRYGEAWVNSIAEYEEMTDEEIERSQRIVSLQADYSELMSEEFYFDYNGEEWSFERLGDEVYELSYEDWGAIFDGLYEEKAKAVGEIFIEIVQLNDEIAKENGYDNYAEYAYDNVYPRDYTVDDAKQLINGVKKIAGYRNIIEGNLDNVMQYNPGWITQDDTATYEMLLPEMYAFDEDFGLTLEYILDNNLYDLEPTDTKVNQGYTISLGYYGDAFIFDSPICDEEDLFTYVHEFGHYNYYFHMISDRYASASNPDVSEIHSQGLELLYTPHYYNVFDENTATYFECKDVSLIINNIISASLVAEFEIYVAEHPDSTIEELGIVYNDLKDSYGTGLGTGGYDYTWVEITHLFQAPMYYISYATSAMVSLELYNISQDNYDLALEKYMEITTVDEGMPFTYVCEMAGVDSIFDERNARRIIASAGETVCSKAK